ADASPLHQAPDAQHATRRLRGGPAEGEIFPDPRAVLARPARAGADPAGPLVRPHVRDHPRPAVARRALVRREEDGVGGRAAGSHNRSVISLAGDADRLKAAVVALFETAIARIDLRTHTGERPRLGAVDVVPFVPIEGVTMEECVALAKDTARTIAQRFNVPV